MKRARGSFVFLSLAQIFFNETSTTPPHHTLLSTGRIVVPPMTRHETSDD
jgi:hypothetical protein